MSLSSWFLFEQSIVLHNRRNLTCFSPIIYTFVNYLLSVFSTCLVTFLTSASTALSMHNNSIFHDLKSEEVELLYSAYGDETGIQCALR